MSRPDIIENFIAIGETDQIALTWAKAKEIDTVRYHIYRRSETESKFILIKKIFELQ